MTIVIADDITGAAEICGIALCYGLKTSLLTEVNDGGLSECDVCVIATDTRSSNAAEAIAEHTGICRVISKIRQCRPDMKLCIFKKTDSALRGHILDEISAAKDVLSFSNCLLIPQNPTKERVIDKGVYKIDGVPIHETPFSFDPEYPAATSVASDILNRNSSRGLPVENLYLDASMESGKTYIADAVSLSDIERQLLKADGNTLLAGGADFFSVILSLLHNKKRTVCRGTLSRLQDAMSLNTCKTDAGKIIIACGSTQSKPVLNEPLMRIADSAEINVPLSLPEGKDAHAWINEACIAYHKNDILVIGVENHKVMGADYARRIKKLMAETASMLAGETMPAALIIEGGATAFAILSELRWNRFAVEVQFSPGVIGIRPVSTGKCPLVVLKPGSYPWGKLFETS